MYYRTWIRLHRSLPVAACALCGSLSAGAEALPFAAPSPPAMAAVQPVAGVEINYELLSPANSAPGPARLEGSVSGSYGKLRSSVLVSPVAEGGRHVARLDTAWQTEAPGLLQTLVVGDTFGSGGGWSRPVRFGGLRFGRSLALRPGYIAAPAGGMRGAALPGTPLPLLGGPVEGIGVARGALPARSTSMEQPAIANAAALPAGATDYEVEAGRLRTGWATADASYGEGYAAAAYRAGLGAELTAEARAEWTPSRTAAGLEMSRGFGPAGTVRAVLAQSGTAQESGLRWGMGVVGNGEGAAWTLSWDGFDRGFTPLAAASGAGDSRDRIQADAKLSLWPGASASLAYTRQTTWDWAPSGLLGLSAQLPLLQRSSLSVKYSVRAGGLPDRQVGVTLVVPLGDDRL